MRKVIITGLLKSQGKDVGAEYENLKQLEFADYDLVKKRQEEKLRDLLLHCAKYVPYYKSSLKAFLESEGKDLSLFYSLPALTKKELKEHKDLLTSTDCHERACYKNFSGGSTGVPVAFVQDKHSWSVTIAQKWLFYSFLSDTLPLKNIKLWGSDRDVMQGSLGWKAQLKNLLYKRKVLNAFAMDEDKMRQFVKEINAFKPELIEAYVEPAAALARFILKEGISVHKPLGVMTSAGTLYPDMKDVICKAFGDCPVLDKYGSREVGDIACSCKENSGLHLNCFSLFVEILDENMREVKAGEIGKVYVTTLDNYSMPLLRYELGDMARVAKEKKCSCGRSMPLVSEILGREMNMFVKRDGTLVSGEFFIHFFSSVYNDDSVQRFQVVQKDYEELLIRVVLKDKEAFEKAKPKLLLPIRKIMGESCRIDFEECEDIPPLKSGKFLYTVCEIDK
ncbi:phenylacetate--CoA ligase family protein [Candidatus Woesearchaeota archaeon]|nr:phenylacetate--CoA ligase family protein [Nanoarchaeota archaeon]MCB9370746.1 phenylacetate--CoA ligase family protein [Candidatus Woesearchaeota archaeon]USN43821.1 MAG: phenylacetate--CoA ligase family protein [Candidatus Woesearchaeota archaeon]